MDTSQLSDDDFLKDVPGGASTPPVAGVPPVAATPPQSDEDFLKSAQTEHQQPMAPLDYANMPWREGVNRGLANIPTDLMALPNAVMHPSETWEGLKSIARGAGSDLGIYGSASPQDVAAASAAAAPYTAAWSALHGDTTPLKQQMIEHPLGTPLAFAPVASGGAGIAGKLGEAAEAAGAAAPITAGLQGASKVLGGVGTALNLADPVYDATKIASGIGGPLATRTMATLSGKPASVFSGAYGAAAQGGDALQTFNDFARGNQGPLELSDRAKTAMQALKNDDVQKWAATKAGIAEANKGDVPLTNTQQALQDQWAKMGPRSLAFDPTVHDKFQDAWNTIAQHGNAPLGDPAASITGIDLMKQRLYNLAQSERGSPELKNALMAVHNAVGQDLRTWAPSYGKLMDQYQGNLDKFNTLTKELGTGSNTSAATEMNKFLRAQKTPNGQRFIDQLAEKDPLLPHAVAGAAFNTGHGSLGARDLIELGAAAMHGMYTGSPVAPMAATAAAVYGHSPGIQRAIPQAAGYVSRAAPAVGVGYTGLRTAAQAEQRARGATGTAYARGGRAGHQHLVDRLFQHVERAKKAEKAHTSSLLQQPDSAIAKALNVAQAAI